MPARLLFAIVFIEGYCSLGAEVVALRRMIPHVGSAITVTAPTIGFFLLALALGYHAGGRIAADFRAVVARNFLAAAILLGGGLSATVVDNLFAAMPDALAYLMLVGGVLCPIAWLLGQTVPILANLTRTERSGEAAGQALYWSTLGSFLGSITLSLGMMQWLGVWSAVLLGALLLLAGALVAQPPSTVRTALATGIAALAFAINLGDRGLTATAYADYRVEPVRYDDLVEPRVLRVNNQAASLIDAGQPAAYSRYVRRLRQILLDELAFDGRDILVLGAGGFTLSHDEPRNRYTYVDIDPAMRTVAERDFLRQPVRGEFVAADARRFVRDTAQRFDAVVVDVYTARRAIPGHLVTREFWRDSRRALKPSGILLANLILDGRLSSPYARNLLATVESVYGRCAVEVLARQDAYSNVVVACFADDTAPPARIYVDELNRADIDSARSP